MKVSEARIKGKFYAQSYLQGLITHNDAVERMSVLTRGEWPSVFKAMINEYFNHRREQEILLELSQS